MEDRRLGKLAEIEISQEEGVIIVSVSGEFDFGVCEQLIVQLSASGVKDPRGIVYDLDRASFLDSEGIKAMLQCARKVLEKWGEKMGARVAIIAPRGIIHKTLTLTGIIGSGEREGIFRAFASTDLALEHIKSQ